MPFVREKISEEDRIKYNLASYNYGGYFSGWTIDRDRQVFMVRTGVDKEGISRFWLNWKGHVLQMAAEWEVRNIPDETWYKVTQLNAASLTKEEKAEVLELFREAIEVSESHQTFPKRVIKFTFTPHVQKQLEN
jgi:hypothetical protein